MIAHCGFDLHFPDAEPLYVPGGHLHVFLGKTYIRFSCPVLNQIFFLTLLSCESSLYLLDVKPLSSGWLQLFSPILEVAFSFHFPGGSDGKESACSGGDLGLISGLGRAPGGGHGNPAQYSCLENSMDRGAWQVTVHSWKESDTTEATEHAHREREAEKTVTEAEQKEERIYC